MPIPPNAQPSNANSQTIIVWLRQDLRLADNPALQHAITTGLAIVPVFIWDEISPDVRKIGSAQKWWLHHSLSSLSNDISKFGGRLILKSGPAEEVLAALVEETGASGLYWNRRYGEGEQAVDRTIKSRFSEIAKSFPGLLMHEPTQVRTGSGTPYKVYTPFWKNFSAGPPPRQPYPVPRDINFDAKDLNSESLDDWHLLPTEPDWSSGIRDEWSPGEAGASKRLSAFLNRNIDAYDEARDLPGPDRTSKLSPHLRFGEISPYQLWHASFEANGPTSAKAREIWRKELVWREFSYHLLQEWPDLAENNFNKKYDCFPWEENPAFIKAWKTGMTGYPIVDAGMRQLWQTGWMHNRVRMIVGSFLVKHLLQDWRHGEKWFWDTLVDADPAANTAQWQWVAGTGADAAPYFRIFNPIMQATKFDKSGEYIKKFVPELKDLAPQYLAAPWDAPLGELRAAGVKLGETYPLPIVDHKEARNKALDALQQCQNNQSN